MRRLLRFASATAVACAAALAVVSPAFGHAQLVSTVPENNTVVAEAPANIELSFTEPVEISLGAIRLYDSSGQRLQTSPATHSGGDDRRVVTEAGNLGPGTYVAAWRAVSADGHPVRGSFAFQVGSGALEDTSALTRALLGSDDESAVVRLLFTAARAIEIGALALVAGGVLFVSWILRGRGTSGRAARLLWLSWFAAVAAALSSVPLHAAYAGGLRLTDAFTAGAIDAVLDTRFGAATVARLAVLVALAVVIALSTRTLSTGAALSVRVVGSVVAVASLVPASVSGHAGSRGAPIVAIATDVTHQAAVAFWLGGIVMLVAAVLGVAADGAGTILSRFSRAAVVAVAVIAATGAARTWQEAGSLHQLLNSPYGRVLGLKLALFVAVIAVAERSRRLVRRRSEGAEPSGDQAVRRLVVIEIAMAAAIVVVTAFLVNMSPAKNAPAKQADVFAAYLESAELLVQVTVDPPNVGPTVMHVFVYDPAGSRLVDVPELSGEMNLASKDITGLAVPLERAGPGHFVAPAFQLPVKGEWELVVNARTSEVDSIRLSTTVPVQ